MKAQNIFNRVAKHLLKQGHKALSEDGSCVFRSYNGDRCAVGALIPRRLYSKKIEKYSVRDIFKLHPEIRDHIGNDNYKLLIDLQDLHDELTESEWPRGLESIAMDHNLRCAL